MRLQHTFMANTESLGDTVSSVCLPIVAPPDHLNTTWVCDMDRLRYTIDQRGWHLEVASGFVGLVCLACILWDPACTHSDHVAEALVEIQGHCQNRRISACS